MNIAGTSVIVTGAGSGTDNIDIPACTKRGIIVAHTPMDMVECTRRVAIHLQVFVVLGHGEV